MTGFTKEQILEMLTFLHFPEQVAIDGHLGTHAWSKSSEQIFLWGLSRMHSHYGALISYQQIWMMDYSLLSKLFKSFEL